MSHALNNFLPLDSRKWLKSYWRHGLGRAALLRDRGMVAPSLSPGTWQGADGLGVPTGWVQRGLPPRPTERRAEPGTLMYRMHMAAEAVGNAVAVCGVIASFSWSGEVELEP